MTLILPSARPRYDEKDQQDTRDALEREDSLNFKTYQDIILQETTLYLTSPDGTQYPVTVDNDGNIGLVGYGGIYTTDGSTAQTGIGLTPVKLTGFVNNGTLAKNVIPDAANDRITIDVDGVYLATYNISFTGSNNTDFGFSFAIDGTPVVTKATQATGSQGDISSVSMSTPIACTVGQQVEMYVKAQASNRNLTPLDMQMFVHLIGVLDASKIVTGSGFAAGFSSGFG